MIVRTPIAKGICLLASMFVVSGGAWLAAPDLEISLEGGGKAVEARMGTSFEDMVQGTLTAQTARDMTPEETAPEAVEPMRQAALTPRTMPNAAAQPQPSDMTPTQPTTSLTPVPSNGPDAVVMAARPLAPVQPSQPMQAVVPTPPTALAPKTPPVEALAGKEPESAAPPQSMRPKRRNPEQAARIAALRPKPELTKPAAKPRTARGNAQRNNTQGAQTSTNAQAKAAPQGTTERASAQAGNAAASNYPGQVMRRISRVPKPRVNVRGTTVVAFAVSSGGGLAGVSVARSSGSSALDQAALRVIRKAAPFPKPPRGAQRQFSIRIKGR